MVGGKLPEDDGGTHRSSLSIVCIYLGQQLLIYKVRVSAIKH